jgi:hypothetical protein
MNLPLAVELATVANLLVALFVTAWAWLSARARHRSLSMGLASFAAITAIQAAFLVMAELSSDPYVVPFTRHLVVFMGLLQPVALLYFVACYPKGALGSTSTHRGALLLCRGAAAAAVLVLLVQLTAPRWIVSPVPEGAWETPLDLFLVDAPRFLGLTLALVLLARRITEEAQAKDRQRANRFLFLGLWSIVAFELLGKLAYALGPGVRTNSALETGLASCVLLPLAALLFASLRPWLLAFRKSADVAFLLIVALAVAWGLRPPVPFVLAMGPAVALLGFTLLCHPYVQQHRKDAEPPPPSAPLSFGMIPLTLVLSMATVLHDPNSVWVTASASTAMQACILWLLLNDGCVVLRCLFGAKELEEARVERTS